MTKNNDTPHLKSAKSRLGTASNQIAAGLELVCGRPTLALSSAMVPQTLSCKSKELQQKYHHGLASNELRSVIITDKRVVRP